MHPRPAWRGLAVRALGSKSTAAVESGALWEALPLRGRTAYIQRKEDGPRGSSSSFMRLSLSAPRGAGFVPKVASPLRVATARPGVPGRSQAKS